MSAHNFGRRFIRLGDFVSYAKHLGVPDPFLEDKLEFAERIGVLVPAARVRFPDPIVRRWHVERYQGDVVTESIEPDGPRLDAANSLRNALAADRMYRSRYDPRQRHPLDVLSPEHRPFVVKRFPRSRFVAWSELQTPIGTRNGHAFVDPSCCETYYHAWQVFVFAAFLRSGVVVRYNIFRRRALTSPLDLGRDDLDVGFNGGAYHELVELRENAKLFDAVATYSDGADRALQFYGRDRGSNTNRLTADASASLNAAEASIARQVVRAARIKPQTLFRFIGSQCSLWNDARSRHPARLVDEYKRNVAKTIELVRRAFPRYGRKTIVRRVGATGGGRAYALDEMFPDWIARQRQIVEPSLRLWIVPRLAQMPSAFVFRDVDVAEFCDWIERHGFLQLYWHFRRLTDIGPFDDEIGRTAATAEVVAIGSLVEHLVTHMLRLRKPVPTSVLRETLMKKVRALVRLRHGALDAQLFQNLKFTTTEKVPLRRQLGRIDKVSLGGPNASVSKALLRLVVIRNSSTHAGLRGFNRDEMQSFIEALLVAALLLWKVR